MKVTLESTAKIILLQADNGEVQARVWEGTTEGGVKVHAFITRIACLATEDCSVFERELQEQRAPSAAVQAVPLRLIL